MPMTPAGFDPDAGDAYFDPADTIFAIELLDSLQQHSEFGLAELPGSLFMCQQVCGVGVIWIEPDRY